MLINDDKEGRKKKKYYRKVMKTNRSRSRKGWHRIAALTGGLLTVAAVCVMVTGMFSSTSRASQPLVPVRLVTNTDVVLPGDEVRVMNGTEVYIEGYEGVEQDKVAVYYKFYSQPVEGEVDLSVAGELYMPGKPIALNKSIAEDGTNYLYIQQKKELDAEESAESEESLLQCYKIMFFSGINALTSIPATSAEELAVVKVGDLISFVGEGTMYYTEDGSEPSFVRAGDGDIQINNEKFRCNNDRMIKMEVGNAIEVTEDWLQQEMKIIRVIAYKDGYDLSPVCNFRFKVIRDQAKPPTITPATSTDSPLAVDAGTEAMLETETQGGLILYTLNGKIPTYSVTKDGEGYKVNPGEGSYIYTAPIVIEGEAESEVVITAVTIKINPETGVSLMQDSEPAQFVYKITPKEKLKAPEATPKTGTELPLDSKIYLSVESTGVTILYTTDGTSPDYSVEATEDGYKMVLKGATQIYKDYIPVKEPEAQRGQVFLVQAKTVKVDLTTGEKECEDSSVVQFSFQITDAETVATPTATPETKEEEPTVVKAGSKIMLSCITAGADIYYTLDGTAPIINEDGTLSKTTKLYSGKDVIVVPEGNGFFIITAVAKKKGMKDSPTVRFNYQYPGTVAPPYATPAEGTVSINTEVSLASIDKKAQIYYTLDGTEPTSASGRLYSDPILLTQDTIIKAICVVDGISSAVKAFTFYVAPELLPPTPSIPSGSVLTSGTTIRLTAQNGAQICYTVDGSSPKEDKAMVGDTVTITGKAGDAITLITYAKGADYSDSQMATYVYTISNYENGIKVNPENGSKVKEGDIITLETDVTNGTIYYAVGGAGPEQGGSQGTQVVVGDAGEESKFTLKAMVVSAGSTFAGSIASYVYEYMERPVAPKASIPNGAVLLEKQDIVLTSENGNIYYTLDGTEPDGKSDIYTEPIQIAQAATIKAVTISDEGAQSEVSAFTYTFAEQTKTPIFSIKSGEVEAGTSLTISTGTSDAVIYYTTDGQVPDLNNPKNLYIYSGAIILNRPVNIKAMAVKEKMTSSEVVSAVYTVKEPEILIEDEVVEEEVIIESSDRLMSRRAYMGNTGGPTYSDFVLKSATTGVVLSAEEGAIPVDANVEVSESAVDTALNYAVEGSVGSEYGAVACYDVALNQGGVALHPEGKVEIGIPIVPQYRNSTFSIAYIDEDGNVETYETRRDNDMAYAHVTHFGRYCIVAPVNLDKEESDLNIKKWIPVIGATLLAVGYLLLRLGRKKKKED